ncbi:MAG: hypothetical protein ACE5LV_08805 [Candidatus Aminicenantales bacterium]
MKKPLAVAFVILVCGSWLLSQSLVEAAKKERERRASLKKKSVLVLTNADLRRGPRSEGIRPETQETPPQKKQGIRPVVRAPSETADAAGQEDVDRADIQSFAQNFATQVLSSTQFVQNPQLALDKPDGRYALLGYFGFLDLECRVRNGPGNDLAVYARRPREGILPETMNYAVFVEYRGEWHHIGTGAGITSPEAFDLGEIPSAGKIRLVFKDYTQTQITKPYRTYAQDYAIGIDAVEVLHRIQP